MFYPEHDYLSLARHKDNSSLKYIRNLGLIINYTYGISMLQVILLFRRYIRLSAPTVLSERSNFAMMCMSMLYRIHLTKHLSRFGVNPGIFTKDYIHLMRVQSTEQNMTLQQFLTLKKTSTSNWISCMQICAGKKKVCKFLPFFG